MIKQPPRYLLVLNSNNPQTGVLGYTTDLDNARTLANTLKDGDRLWVFELTHRIDCEMKTPTTEVRHLDSDEIPF